MEQNARIRFKVRNEYEQQKYYKEKEGVQIETEEDECNMEIGA